jgi:wobble nucleotide-excising tRNase
MDSSALFIVSALVREMIEICRNNASLNVADNFTHDNYIKQLFILTHNTYFHHEITYNQVKYYDSVSFYLIDKLDNRSSVKLCKRYGQNVSGDLENYNPVQNAYAALWSEFSEVNSSIPLLNVIRRILDYYFLQLCGYDSADIRDKILKENKDKFITIDDDGRQNHSQYQVASSMLSYLNASSNSLSDGLNYVDDCIDSNQIRKTFAMIFELMQQSQHYNMMIGHVE